MQHTTKHLLNKLVRNHRMGRCMWRSILAAWQCVLIWFQAFYQILEPDCRDFYFFLPLSHNQSASERSSTDAGGSELVQCLHSSSSQRCWVWLRSELFAGWSGCSILNWGNNFFMEMTLFHVGTLSLNLEELFSIVTFRIKIPLHWN